MELTPSQRVKLATAVRDGLSAEAWPYINTTLGTFGAPDSKEWEGYDRPEYVFAGVVNVPADLLVEMAEHFGYSLPGAAKPIASSGKESLHVFVSHLSAHRCFAAALQLELAKYGIVAFIAHKDIEPTKEWQIEIERQLLECDALVALLHEGFHDSLRTDQEIGFAMGRRVPAFSVQLGQTPYGFIGKFQAFSGHGKTAPQLARELFETFLTNSQTQHVLAKTAVRMFAKSPSYDQANIRTGYLEALEVWNSDLAAEVAEALEENDQIQGARGVRARVTAVLKKWGHAPK